MNRYKYLTGFLLMLLPMVSQAQDDVAMADTFRQEGKIYVVVAVALVILTGIFVYLFLLDRKVSKIEKQLKK
jgi:CcmD family protein